MPTNAGAGGVDRVARQPMQNGSIESAPTIRRRRQYTTGAREETSLLGFLNILLVHRRLIAVCAVVGAVILGVRAFDSTRFFRAYASFTVRGARSPSQLSAVATQLGLTMGSLDENQSLAFYADLVTTNAILAPVARMPYSTSARGGGERPLAAFFGIDERNPGVAASRALDELRSRVTATSASRTGVISLWALAEHPRLAQQILQNVLTELDTYNLAMRRKRAVAERDFIERRVAEAGAALAQAERQLSAFLQTNRDYAGSPMLQMEFDRLQRAVRMRQQIYTAMARSLEDAKIEEVRDLPTVLIIDQPEAGLEPLRPPVVRRTLLGLIAGLFVGIVLAFLRERAAETRNAGTSAYTEYSALKRKALGELARPLAPLSRLLKGHTRA